MANAREKRRSPRYQVRLDARVIRDADQVALELQMRDFCDGGLLLMPRDRALAAPIPFALGDELSVQVVVQHKGKSKRLKLPTRVVRVSQGDLGLSFPKPIPQLLSVLEAYVEQMPQSSAPAAQVGQGDLSLRLLHERFAEQAQAFFPGIVAELQRLTLEQLTESMTESGFGTRSLGLQEGQIRLKGLAQDTETQLLPELLEVAGRVLGLAEASPNGTSGGSTGELSLMATDTFEDWLAAAEVSNRLADAHADKLLDLDIRLGQLRGFSSASDLVGRVPYHPQAIIDALTHWLDRQGVSRDVRQALYRASHILLRTELNGFYGYLLSLLTHAGLESARLRISRPAPSPEPANHRAPPDSSDPNTHAPPPKGRVEAANTSSGSHEQPRRDGHGGPYHDLIQELPILFGEGVKPLSQAPLEVAEPDAVEPSRLLSMLNKLAESKGLTFDPKPQERDRIQQTEALLNALDRSSATPILSENLGYLQRPLLQSVLQDLSFFSDSSHPMRVVLDQLERLDSLLGHRNDLNAVSWERITQWLRDLGEKADVQSAAEVGTQLTSLGDRLKAQFHRNFDRVAAQSQGQFRLQQARAWVAQDVNRLYRGQSVPSWFNDLLTAGGLKLLELELLQHGRDSDAYRLRWRQFEQLVTDAPRLLRDPAEAQLSSDLANVSMHPQKLEHCLRAAALPADTVKFTPLDVESAAAEMEIPSGVENSTSWKHLLEKVQQLALGDPLECVGDNGEKIPRLLAWRSEQGDRLVLVDQRGIKAESLSTRELVFLLRQGQFRLVKPQVKPLSERVTDDLLQRMEERLAFHASHDPLTGLYNRTQFQNLLRVSLREISENPGTQASLILIDMDQFNAINNACGFEAGDKLLTAVATQLENEFDNIEVLGYLGGVQFGLLLPSIGLDEAVKIADRLRLNLTAIPFYWNSRPMPIYASLGVVGLNQVDGNLGRLLQAADAAVQAVKTSGGNRVCRFDPDDREIIQHWNAMEWLVKLNNTLKAGKLNLRCQLIQPLDPGKGFKPHFEILLGVMDENGQDLNIGHFIRVAEINNRMNELDRWVTATAVAWAGRNLELMRERFGGGLAINLSGQTMNDEHFPDFVRELFALHGVEPGLISFEITETLAIGNLKMAHALVDRIKSLGCHFALDDFGSGLSSFAYLKELPVDFVKIDGLFIKDIARNKNDYAMVKSINEIGHFLGKPTIAEYVEDSAIIDCLKEIGVDFAQGWAVEKTRLMESLSAGY